MVFRGWLISCLGFCAVAHGEPAAPEFGAAAVLGQGCAQALKVSAKTGEGVEVHFPDFVLASSTGRNSLRCLVRVPVAVPAGFQARWLAGEWKGSALVGSEGSATVAGRIFFAGEPESELGSRNLGEDGAWAIPVPEASGWSPCGEETVLTLLLNLTVRAAQERVELRPGTLSLPPLVYRRCAGGGSGETESR